MRLVSALIVASSVLLVALLTPSAYAESSAVVSAGKLTLGARRFLDDDHHDHHDDHHDHHDDHHDDHHHDDHHDDHHHDDGDHHEKKEKPKPKPKPSPKPKPHLTCMQKFQLKHKSCADKKHECMEKASGSSSGMATCEAQAKTCGRKAYQSFKNCKYGKWGCKDWCLYHRRQCYKGHGVGCEAKYATCVKACTKPKKAKEHDHDDGHDDHHDDHHHDDDHHDHHDDHHDDHHHDE
ncbi:unnamed protein product [Closterium sp. NIES-53]